MLVNICLDWQSRASLAAATRLAPGPLLVELPANCTAGCPWGGAGDRLAATRGCEGRWAGPGPTPPRQQACAPGPSSSPHWGRGGESRREVSLDSKQAAFPRRAPHIYVFLILEENKTRDKTLGVVLRITAHHLPQHGMALALLPVPTAVHGGAHTGTPGLLLGPRRPGGSSHLGSGRGWRVSEPV